MIKLINTFNNYSHSIIKRLVPSFSGMLRVKAGRPLINYVLSMWLLVKGSITNSSVKVTVSFVRFMYRMSRRNGIAYTAKYMKSSVTLLMQALSGERHSSSQELGLGISRTRFGLPRVIPAVHRKHIRNGDLYYIRLWLSLLSLYRVIDFVGKLQIKTIVTPSKAVIDFSEVRNAASTFRTYGIFNCDKQNDEPSPFPINASSPQSSKAIRDEGDRSKILVPSGYSTALHTIVKSLRTYADLPILRKSYLGVANALGYQHSVIFAMSFSRFLKRYVPDTLVTSLGIPAQGRSEFLGKLAFKIEPAGKIRVFAMVDCWTQWLLRPLHRDLFKFLRTIPSDATFNQGDTLNKFVASLKERNIRKVYSFDLTAATDRIPLNVQTIILDTLFNRDFGSFWAALLVERWYQIPLPSWDWTAISVVKLGVPPGGNDFVMTRKVDWRKGQVEIVDAVRYATGQPMGALSSWAMLAVTHHVMVRIASLRCGLKSFSDYLVLGDDLVIAHPEVAREYLNLAREWDIGINLSKSVISRNGSLEFAKRFVYKYQDVSGLSFKEMCVAKWDIRGLIQLFNRVKAFRNIRISEALSFLGHGYRALSRLTTKYEKLGLGMRRALLLLSYPTLIFSSLPDVESWLFSTAFNRSKKPSASDEAIAYLKELGIKMADIKQSDLPRTPEEFRKRFHSLYGIDKKGNPNFPDNGEQYFFSPLVRVMEKALMSMYYKIQESWDTTVVEVKDTFEWDDEDLDVNTLWSALETLEDIASGAQSTSEFRPIKDIITLGSSTLLKRADKFRSMFPTLAGSLKK
jgi:hypothetical protein